MSLLISLSAYVEHGTLGRRSLDWHAKTLWLEKAIFSPLYRNLALLAERSVLVGRHGIEPVEAWPQPT